VTPVVELAALGLAVAVAGAAVAALLGALQLGDVEAQAGADLLGVDLGDRAALAQGRLPGALPQPAGDHHPVALGQRVGEVDRLVAPDGDALEGGRAGCRRGPGRAG
jgi:hypothetical protein